MSLFNTEELKELQEVVRKSTDSNRDKFLNVLSDVLDSINNYTLCLWDFEWDYGRQGVVSGRIKASKEHVKNIIGKTIHFGEILGKHSEVVNTIDEEDLTLVSDDPFTVDEAEVSGYDPFAYWTCTQCGYEIDADTGKCSEGCTLEEEKEEDK
jgi:hypothetical protein